MPSPYTVSRCRRGVALRLPPFFPLLRPGAPAASGIWDVMQGHVRRPQFEWNRVRNVRVALGLARRHAWCRFTRVGRSSGKDDGSQPLRRSRRRVRTGTGGHERTRRRHASRACPASQRRAVVVHWHGDEGAPRCLATWGKRVQRPAQTGTPFPRTVEGLLGEPNHYCASQRMQRSSQRPVMVWGRSPAPRFARAR